MIEPDPLQQQIDRLQAEIDQLRASLPAHSVPPSMLIRLEDLEEELARLIAAAKPSQNPSD